MSNIFFVDIDGVRQEAEGEIFNQILKDIKELEDKKLAEAEAKAAEEAAKQQAFNDAVAAAVAAALAAQQTPATTSEPTP
jgi:uncharacterized tellurite resistance protein B-like protein